jgi:nitroreductase
MIGMDDVLKLIKRRQSTRSPFNPKRRIAKATVEEILEAGRWAPTPHNMQNFEVVVVDDKNLLKKIGSIKSHVSEAFLRENYKQFSFSKEELLRKKVGVLNATFPEAWRDPKRLHEVAEEASSPMSQMIRGSPMLLFVVYDQRKRAPASKNDVLGFIGLGCVMENMWLMSTSLGLGFHILSTFSNDETEKQVKRILKIPAYMKIGFTVRLGFPASEQRSYLRVRRDLDVFVHYNRFSGRLQGRSSG